MAIILDDDFQSYSVGATPPFGNLCQLISSVPVVENTEPGLFGDSKYLRMPAVQSLIWPIQTPSISLAAYTELSIFLGVRYLGTGTSQNGILFEFDCNLSTFVGNICGFIIIGQDGTWGTSLDGSVSVSNFSMLQQKWYWVQINVFWSAGTGGKLVMNTVIAVNGITVLTTSNQANSVLVSDLAALYVNNFRFGGLGGGSQVGRMTIYDHIQTIGFAPHAGSPIGKVSQGLIELIKQPGSTPSSGGSRIYEA